MIVEGKQDKRKIDFDIIHDEYNKINQFAAIEIYCLWLLIVAGMRIKSTN